MREAELNRREAAFRRAEKEAEAAAHAALPVMPAVPEPRPISPYDLELEKQLAQRLVSVERRERELEQVVEAVEAQRQRLEEIQREYEERRAVLSQRTREVEAERALLAEEHAKLAAAAIEAAPVSAPAPAPAQPAAAPPAVEAPVVAEANADDLAIKPAMDALVDPAPAVPGRPSTIDDWWAKQLGSPLEAA